MAAPSSNVIDFLKQRELVHVGEQPNDNTGDTLRDAYIKINEQLSQITTLMDTLGLSVVPENVKAVLSDDEKLNGHYALKNGSGEEDFSTKLLSTLDGLSLGNDSAKLLSSDQDLYGFAQLGKTSSFLVNNDEDGTPNLVLKLGTFSSALPNSVLFGINFFDQEESAWKNLLKIQASGKVSILDFVLIDETGQVPAERLRHITGNVDPSHNTLEKISGVIKNAPKTEIEVYDFPSDSLVWREDHEKGTRAYSIEVFSQDGEKILVPYRLQPNFFEVNLSKASRGYVVATFKV